MNTFLNLQQEFILPKSWNLMVRARTREEMKKPLGIMLSYSVNQRIAKRGEDEQFKSRYLSNYIGAKRLSKSQNIIL